MDHDVAVTYQSGEREREKERVRWWSGTAPGQPMVGQKGELILPPGIARALFRPIYMDRVRARNKGLISRTRAG
jgi:hypothetical protein